MTDQPTPDDVTGARRAELEAEAHRNAVVRNGGTVAERTAADRAAREAAARHDAARARRRPA